MDEIIETPTVTKEIPPVTEATPRFQFVSPTSSQSRTNIAKPSGIGGIPANLSRLILRGENINPARQAAMIEQFVHKFNLANSRTVTPGKKIKHQTPGNLSREINRPKMTFKVFIKFLQVLKWRNVTIIVQGTSAAGREIIYSTPKIDLTDINLLNEDEEENDDE